MPPSELPFPRYWWGIGLEDAGLADLRPDDGTYGRYEFDRLPALPYETRGDFAWLAAASLHEQSVGEEKAAGNAEALPRLRASAARLGVPLPEAFVRYMETPALHRRVRSCTDCYLDLCPEPVRSPVGGGLLVRFLSDSQGCLFWYLYLAPGGRDHCVVASPGFYGSGAEMEQWAEWDEAKEGPPDPDEIVYCAESFEAFLCRFWLENEVWFAGDEGVPLSDACREYVERYRSGNGGA